MNAPLIADRMLMRAARDLKAQMDAKSDLAEVNAKKAAHLDWLLACAAKNGITVRYGAWGDLIVGHGINEAEEA